MKQFSADLSSTSTNGHFPFVLTKPEDTAKMVICAA